jgi:hypothetical protein
VTPNDEPVNDPFAEFTPKQTQRAPVDAAAGTIGGVIFGGLVGAACAYFWSLDYYIAGGIGAAIGGLAGWMSTPPKSSP